MGTYRLSEEAKNDLTGIHQYGVREFGETQADDYFWKIIQKLDVVAETPELYQKVPEIREGYRRSVCGVHAIYYRIDGNTVEVMAILKSQDSTLRFGTLGP